MTPWRPQRLQSELIVELEMWATMSKSPVTARYANWPASPPSQISNPEPDTV
jgi:hypothetical protein